MNSHMILAVTVVILIAGRTTPPADTSTRDTPNNTETVLEQPQPISIGSELIPIETVEEEGGIITIEYELTEALSLEDYGQDIMFVFGAALAEHADSKTIIVHTTVGEETVLTCTAATTELQELVDETTEKSVEDIIVCE